MLQPLSGGVVDHVAARKALEMAGYGGWVSLEMKRPESAAQLVASVLSLKSSYADESAS
jgi:sugar phosphate isomerase/epimerase